MLIANANLAELNVETLIHCIKPLNLQNCYEVNLLNIQHGRRET